MIKIDIYKHMYMYIIPVLAVTHVTHVALRLVDVEYI